MGKQKIHKFFIFPDLLPYIDGSADSFVPRFHHFSRKILRQKDRRRSLRQQGGRDAEAEVPVPRFVAEDQHSQQRAGAAEQQRERKERFSGTRRAPGIFARRLSAP